MRRFLAVACAVVVLCAGGRVALAGYTWSGDASAYVDYNAGMEYARPYIEAMRLAKAASGWLTSGSYYFRPSQLSPSDDGGSGPKATRAWYGMMLAERLTPLDTTTVLVPGTDWYWDNRRWLVPYANQMAKAGLIPYSAFSDGPITRQEAFSWVARICGLGPVAQAMTDGEVSTWLGKAPDGSQVASQYRRDVALAMKLGICKGSEGGYILPNQELFREHAAIIAYRAIAVWGGPLCQDTFFDFFRWDRGPRLSVFRGSVPNPGSQLWHQLSAIIQGVDSVKKNPIAIAILVVTMVVSASGLTVHAESGDKAIPVEAVTRRDTLSLTQEEYMKASHEAPTTADGDESKIEVACETFLTLGKAYVRNPKAYDCTVFVESDSMGKNTIQYRLSEYQYLSALYEALGWEILWDDLAFTDFKASIDGDHATASVVESYRYYLNNDFNKESFRRRMLSLELLRGPAGWRITDVTSNDACESADGFEYIPIEVEGTINALLAEMEEARSASSVLGAPMDAKADVGASILRTEYPYFWTYDTDAAVAYAENHYDDTSNPVFGFNTGKNCQNFASQCVWAGLGGTGTDPEASPAVSTTEAGSSAFNVWCHGQYTDFYDNTDFNWAWDNVCGFFNLMAESRTDAEGPYGNSVYSNAVAYAQVGNVLAFDKEGAPAAATLDHAMFVTAVTGTAGQRTKTNVMVAGHTTQTDTAYQTLAEYIDTASRPVSYFARAYIYGGYYPDPQ